MSRDLAVSFVKEIKNQGLTTPKLEISSLGGLSFVTAYNETPNTIMVNDSTAGVDYNPDVAILKALVEYFERQTFSEAIGNGDPICSRRHSDGVAAYPQFDTQAKLKARANAYGEALERYVWAKWWDDVNMGHSFVELEKSDLWQNMKVKLTIESFKDLLPIESIFLVEPYFDQTRYSVLIFFAKIKNLGYISGGAAGLKNERVNIATRGIAELIRHGLGITQFLDRKQKPQTFYEERLLYYGLGKGNSQVELRLRNKSVESIKIPDLEIDNEIKSQKFGNLVTVHRCLFKDQPPFVDGQLERLCL